MLFVYFSSDLSHMSATNCTYNDPDFGLNKSEGADITLFELMDGKDVCTNICFSRETLGRKE